jgi:hypothetical protein
MGDLLPLTARVCEQLVGHGDVSSFLTTVDLNKDHCERLIAWLIAFDILPQGAQAISDSITRHIQQYKDLVRAKLAENADYPTRALSREEGKLIEDDTQRGIAWFTELARQIGVPDSDLSLAQAHTSRILTMLSLSGNDLRYAQGFERFAFISYCLALKFSITAQMEDFAEPITYYLTEKLIRLSRLTPLLETDVVEEHFEKLDVKIKKLCPEVWRALERAGHSSVHFALRWEILMFADEHNLAGKLLIWDQLIARRRPPSLYTRYLRWLCLAHIGQVRPESDDQLLGQLQNNKNWDVPALISSANLLARPRAISPVNWGVISVTVVAVAAIFVGVALRRGHH